MKKKKKLRNEQYGQVFGEGGGGGGGDGDGMQYKQTNINIENKPLRIEKVREGEDTKMSVMHDFEGESESERVREMIRQDGKVIKVKVDVHTDVLALMQDIISNPSRDMSWCK